MSFTKAANYLSITQQGISKIISRMEDELQTPLLSRNNAKLSLTEYGNLFLESSLTMLREYNSVIERMEQMKEKRQATLNIYIPMGMMQVFPIDTFNAFREYHSEININLEQAADVECENALISGEADIAFCTLPVDPKLFTVHSTKKQPVYFVVSKKNPLSKCPTLSVSQLKEERFITIDIKNKSGDGFISRCEKEGFVPNVYMRSPDTHLILELCQNNAGISFYIGEPTSISEKVVLIPEEPPNTWDVGLVTLTYRKPSVMVEEFINYFKTW